MLGPLAWGEVSKLEPSTVAPASALAESFGVPAFQPAASQGLRKRLAVRYAIGHGVRRNGFVQNPESADDFGIGIRKQKIRNMLSVRKALELGHTVIADHS